MSSDTHQIDFGHGGCLSPIEIDLMTKGTIEVNGVCYTLTSIDLVDTFTDHNLQPTYNMTIQIDNHPYRVSGNYLATGTIRQCCDHLLSL